MTTTQKILNKYGLDAMREIWIEELLELATVLQKSKRDKVIHAEIITEIADVSFVIKQMFEIYGKESCQHEEEYKISRTIERLGLE